MWRRFKAAQQRGSIPVCHGGIVGQAWRKGVPRQALLAKALAGIDVHPLDDAAGRAAGALLFRSRTSDVLDAALVLLADNGDYIVTSDVDDIAALIETLDRDVEVVRT